MRRLAVLVVFAITVLHIVLEILEYDISTRTTSIALMVSTIITLILANQVEQRDSSIESLDRQLVLYAAGSHDKSEYQIGVALNQQGPCRKGKEATLVVSITGRTIGVKPDQVKLLVKGAAVVMRQTKDQALSSEFVMDTTPEINKGIVGYSFRARKDNPKDVQNTYYLGVQIKPESASELSITANAVKWSTDGILDGTSRAVIVVAK